MLNANLSEIKLDKEDNIGLFIMISKIFECFKKY